MKAIEEENEDLRGVLPQNYTTFENSLLVSLLKALNFDLSDVNEANTFTLMVHGVAFTPNRIVRWNGSNRPTTFVSSTQLTAAIYAANVNALGLYPVTVYGLGGNPAETPPLMSHVVADVFDVYLPAVSR